jgi:DNA modification methylase
VTHQPTLPLPRLELADPGELNVRPRLANATCWKGYDPEMTMAPGRNHPVLARMLLQRYLPDCSHWPAIVVDPMCGPGTFLVEAARLFAHPYGCDISPKCVALARKNLVSIGYRPAPDLTVAEGDATRMYRKWPDGWAYGPSTTADIIITSPVYRAQNHSSGSSAGQEKLRTERGFRAQQEWWDADARGHLASAPEAEFWAGLGQLWREAHRWADDHTRLLVVTKDRIRAGVVYPFTRLVAESIAAEGWELLGRHWRRLDPSNAQRMQVHHDPHFHVIDHEDVIVAKRRPAK